MPKQTLAIALCRVSSLEQLQSNSLSHQRDNVLRAADELGVTIPEDGIWSGHVSSKKGVNYDRKDLKQMLEYCKKHQNVKYLIVQEVDRFMRSPDEQVYFQVKFMNEVGVKIWYADKPELNKDDIYAGLMRYMEGFRAAGSNDERQRKSINGHMKALQEGRFTFCPKPGYMKGQQKGIQEIHPIKGPILRSILLDIANHRLSPSQALVKLNESDFVKGRSLYKMDKFRTIVEDPFYTGIVEMDKQVKYRNENGLHKPLITKKQHLELVRIMKDKKKTQSGPRKNGNPKYPLNNLITCDHCIDKRYGRVVGVDQNNGQTSKIYEKYKCRACGRYIKREVLHSEVIKRFKENPISEDGVKELLRALDIVWKQNECQAEQEAIRINHKITKLREDIREQALAAIDPSNSTIKQEILENIAKSKNEVKLLEDRLEEITNEEIDDKDAFLTFAFDFIDNMGNKFLEISSEKRRVCKQIIFPGGFFMDTSGKVFTPEVSPLIRLATTKKDAEASEDSLLVRVKRL